MPPKKLQRRLPFTFEELLDVLQRNTETNASDIVVVDYIETQRVMECVFDALVSKRIERLRVSTMLLEEVKPAKITGENQLLDIDMKEYLRLHNLHVILKAGVLAWHKEEEEKKEREGLSIYKSYKVDFKIEFNSDLGIREIHMELKDKVLTLRYALEDLC
jgi:hypothetical protein